VMHLQMTKVGEFPHLVWCPVTDTSWLLLLATSVMDLWYRTVETCGMSGVVFDGTRQWTVSTVSLDTFIDHRYSSCRYNHRSATWTVRISFTGRSNVVSSYPKRAHRPWSPSCPLLSAHLELHACRDSSAGIATRYSLNGLGIEPR